MGKKVGFLIFIFLYSIGVSVGQTISGKIVDAEKKPIPFVNVVAKKDSLSNKIIAFTYTDIDGSYLLNVSNQKSFVINYSSLGYQDQKIDIKKFDKNLIVNLNLTEKKLELQEVVIKANKSIKVKKDTVTFNVKSFLRGNEQVVEDVLKNLPGVEVDADGTIRVGNKEIEKVMVEGDDFFEKGYKLLTKNMPNDPIKKVELLKNYSKNKHLKGIENSKKVALNLILNEKAKRIWFGNSALGYGLGSENIYTMKGNLMNFGKKNKYYFLTNLNNTGTDVIGEIEHLIRPYRMNEVSSLGDEQTTGSLVSLDAFVPKFKETRTNFNNAELLSLNAIFNPSKKLKIKSLVFLNSDENNFFRNSIENYQVRNTDFMNTESYFLRKKKKIAFGRFDLNYDFSKTKTLELTSKFNYRNYTESSNLVFNNEGIDEFLQGKNTFFDQKIVYTNKLNKRKVFLLTGRYIFDKSPQNYLVDFNSFLFEDLFPNTNANAASQLIENTMNFIAFEGHFLNRKKGGNLLELRFGNSLRQDVLNSDLLLKQNLNVEIAPNEYSNDLTYFTNDTFIKGKYLLKFNKLALMGNLGVHVLYNRFNTENNSNEEVPIFFNPEFEFKWNIGEKNELTMGASINRTNANVLDVYNNYVLTGYQNFNRGTGTFNQTNASSFNLNHQFGDWGGKFFANTIIFYNKYHDFFSTNTQLTQNYTQSSKILIEDKSLLGISSNLNRFVNSLSSNIKLVLGYSSSNYKNIINDSNLREVKTDNYSYGVEMRSGFNSMFNYHLGTKWTTNSIATTFNQSYTNNNTFLDLSFIFNDTFNFDIQTERYSFGNLNPKNSVYYFADFSAEYKIKSPKISISLVGKNLFNTDTFQEFTINDNGSSITDYRLLSRYVMLTLKYQF
ncbi:TonB-dependent receptor [Tenacibaculum agarivorans]|uniref:TonB-dependent receptor n=1 Tax=Tenacibaculum agarivorans TaxID=1908389 RepID=UPI00094BA9CB|nr:TonB-dependent receptor [Tenacibaculum agarivorans]